MKTFSSLASLDQIRGSPLGPMLREIVMDVFGDPLILKNSHLNRITTDVVDLYLEISKGDVFCIGIVGEAQVRTDPINVFRVKLSVRDRQSGRAEASVNELEVLVARFTIYCFDSPSSELH